jgi:pimeloyl-ACP methyl ester carboxylesterase
MTVAIARLPAKVPVTDERYGGAILINPGGPGGSGVNFLIHGGRSIQTIVSSAQDPFLQSTTYRSNNDGKELYFDVIGFDPRGVNNTVPRVSCFKDEASLASWAVQSQAQGFPYSNETFRNSWSRQVSLARSCAARADVDDEETAQFGRFISTPNVVEDMVAITEALGEWRETETQKLIEIGYSVTEETKARRKWDKGNEKLLYWGFSYGTVLGATFAAMHPKRLGRLALDGVVDTDDYYSGMLSY